MFAMHTEVSQASAHGCSQLKYQKLRVGGCRKGILEWFNYTRASAHPKCTKSTCIVASLVLHQNQPNDEESCIMLESGPTCRNIAKLLQHSSLAVHKFHIIIEKCCEQDYGWVCAKPCCQMLWRLKHIRMIAAMYISSAHLISIYYTRI